MLKTILLASLSLAACVPTTHNTPVYVGGAGRPAAGKARSVAMRGKVARGKRVEYVVAVQIDRQGRRRRIRVRPAADGSYALQLPPGHRYAMAYEDHDRVIGNVSFPNAHGRPSQTINLSQNVLVNQQFIDLGEPTYIGGVYVAAADPEQYLDSDGDGTIDAQDVDDDGDGIADAQDPDENDGAGIVADSSAFEEGDFEDIDESTGVGETDGAADDDAAGADDHDDAN